MISLKTLDGDTVQLPKELAIRSVFLRNVLQETEHHSPIDILFTSEVFKIVHTFMTIDNHVLEEGYNPLEIYFSTEMLSFFDDMSSEMLLDVCNAANYLEYSFLLEITCKVIAGRLAENTRGELAQIIRGPETVSTVEMKNIQDEFEWFDGPI